MVSNSKVENVVYPPIKPIGIRYRQFVFQCAFVANTVTAMPTRNDPVTLITKVPYGNRTPNLPPIRLPTQKRKTEPRNPPMPTIQYLIKALSSFPSCGYFVRIASLDFSTLTPQQRVPTQRTASKQRRQAQYQSATIKQWRLLLLFCGIALPVPWLRRQAPLVRSHQLFPAQR